MPFPYAREHLLIYYCHRLFIYYRHRSKLLSFALPCHSLLSKASPLGTCDALVRKEVPSAPQGFHFNSPISLTSIKQTAQNGMFFKKSCKNILSVHRKAIPLHSLSEKHG